MGNAQSGELRTYLAGQIARALAVFSVDEVIVFDDEGKLKLDDIVEHTVKHFHCTDPNKGASREKGPATKLPKGTKGNGVFPTRGHFCTWLL